MINMTTCPQCHSDHLVGVEVRGVYDGVLFWRCPKCGINLHRFPEGHRLHRLADPYVNPKEGA